jgi:hypothetical protein
MTYFCRLLQMAVLAAVTAFAVLSFPAPPGAAGPRPILCGDDQDCPNGDFCKERPGRSLGICTWAGSVRKLDACSRGSCMEDCADEVQCEDYCFDACTGVCAQKYQQAKQGCRTSCRGCTRP